MSEPTVQQIQQGFQQIQNEICQFLVQATQQPYREDPWKYERGEGGGITRVWEGAEGEPLEKGGVNYSGIHGSDLPASAATQLKIEPGTPFHATGVSLVIHPLNPNAPTIHMNVRYFEAGNQWWFGGGIDLTPYYPTSSQAITFHKGLKEVCERWGHSYDAYKKTCDEYFFLTHRGEARGIGGIFFDHLRTDPKDPTSKSKAELWSFVQDVGRTFILLYRPLISPPILKMPYTEEQRNFQLYRRSRYVEFNLIYDRGTKFGLQSNGRTESILMSLPAVAHWKYDWKPAPGSREEKLTSYFLRPKDWAHFEEEADLLSDEASSIPLTWAGAAGAALLVAFILAKVRS